MPTAITHTMADGIDRNDRGVAAGLLDLLDRGTPSWHADALCKEYPGLTWFPLADEDPTAAIAVCERCLVADECGSWALAQGADLVGIWAGLGAKERRRKRRSAARPASALPR